MISLYSYILESSNPTSDDAILYKIAKYKFNSHRTLMSAGSGGVNNFEKIVKKYHIDKDNPRPGLIRYAKDVMPKLLPDNEEIIHRKDWSLHTLNGETELQLLHPDYWTISQYIAKNHKRKHDILTIFECSNSKPYASNKILKNAYLDKYGVFTDFACMSNPGVIPLEFSQYYPYRFDEWDHDAENDDIAEKYCIVNEQRFLTYVKNMGYKDVIVLMQNPHTQICFDKAYKENADGCKDWLHIVTDKRFHTELDKKYKAKFNNNEGLVITRMLNLPFTKEAYERTLKSCLNESEKKEFDELQKLIKDNDKEEIRKWNEEHGWTPIDYEKGIKTVKFEKYTETSNVVEKEVNKFKTWIEEKLSKIKYDEDIKKFYENEVYFTVLDCLLEYYKDKEIDDPDTQYWNMKAALKKVKGLGEFGNYCFYYKPIVDKLDLDIKDLEEEAVKLKLIQKKLKQQDAKF